MQRKFRDKKKGKDAKKIKKPTTLSLDTVFVGN